MTIACATFDDEAADLALGNVAEPARSALLAHAAGCARCTATLDGLGRTVDALLELAPEAEPPVGFETRAVAAMRAQSPATPSPRTVRPRWLAAAAAIAAVLLVAVGLAGGLRLAHDDRGAVPSALVRTNDGDVLGRVELASSPSPRVVVVVDGAYERWRGTWSCELRRADGTWVEVGHWTAADAPTGAWTAEIDRGLLDATAMRIVNGEHAVVATSERLS